MLQFLNIGYGNIVSAHRIIAIVSPESAPIKRLVQEGREQNILLDATYGRKTRAVIIMDDGHIVLSPIQPETIAQRLNSSNKDDKEEISDEG
ncbi:extracellular matrix/biofilm regulator RemA [Ectobacillus sp. sgz5001026]|uniref:extracellular matrix/biofilm regulator RemA n=1 Tax=Ectobacillus sp. sgz5001026 TaxID=3242473 RepID=UPI0036D3BF96